MTPLVDGQPCPKCGAKAITNPRTGKVFCSAKCWLKNQMPPQQQQNIQKNFVEPQNKADKNRSFAMSYAKDLACAKVIEVKDLSSYASKMFKWLENKPEGNALPVNTVQENQTQEFENPPFEDEPPF